VATDTVDSRVRTSAAGADQAELNVDQTALTLAENLETAQARVATLLDQFAAAAAEAKNTVVTFEQAERDRAGIAAIFKDGLDNGDFKNEAELNAWFIEQLAQASDISPQARLEAAKMSNQFGLEALGSRAAEITRNMEQAWQKGGLGGLADEYEKVLDGIDARVERDGDTVRVLLDRGDGLPEVLDEATGRDAENILGARLMARMKDPMAAMQVAASEAALAQTQSETTRTDAQTANLEAATAKTLQEIANSGGGLSKNQEITQRNREEMLSAEWFVLLDREEKAEALAEFDRQTGSPSAPPVGVPAVDWYAMTPEEQEEFRRAGNR
jgi:hypothetical protein